MTTVWILSDVDENGRVNTVAATLPLAQQAADDDFGTPLTDWKLSRSGRWTSNTGDYEIREYPVVDE